MTGVPSSQNLGNIPILALLEGTATGGSLSQLLNLIEASLQNDLPDLRLLSELLGSLLTPS